MRFVGRVQGVGFRATTRAVALEAGLTGWARNEEDGSVLAEAQGTDEQMARFLRALHDRMGRHIARESSEMMGLIEGERGFEIRR